MNDVDKKQFLSQAMRTVRCKNGDTVEVGKGGQTVTLTHDQIESLHALVGGPKPVASDSAIEQEIQAKGLTAPRVTPADIQACIAGEHYFTAEHGVIGAAGVTKGGIGGDEAVAIVEYKPAKTAHLGLLTFCVLVLRNGTKIVGVNYGPVSPENFDAVEGRRYARENAIEQVWPLMGYELRSKLHERADAGTCATISE